MPGSGGVLARALYSWGLGHAQDRARYMMQAGVRGDMMVRCRASVIMGSAIGQWHMNRVCDRAWVDVCSKYGWYHMHEKLVQGWGHAREKYGKLLVPWGVSYIMLARSREQMVARRGLDRWWVNNCLNGKWAHLCKLAG